ncbi:MAG: DUF309 domain-containing protein [Candidatus Tectomicrobia bacterium]|nr:DUF309 domain-containing protein [Candidatus Tectomicrobia bacterium]
MTRRLEPQEIAGLRQGIAQFRAGEYFEAHDDWEEVWRELSGRRRLFWQAMIQLAVGTHHWEHGNQRGCCSVWGKALQKCDDLGQLYDHDVPAPLLHLICVLDEALSALEHSQDPLPHILAFAASALSDQWVTFA